MGKNIGKNISKSLSGKYSQNIFDHAKQSGACRKTAKELIGNKITNRIAKVPKNHNKIIQRK